jgi:hypothetical protein
MVDWPIKISLLASSLKINALAATAPQTWEWMKRLKRPYLVHHTAQTPTFQKSSLDFHSLIHQSNTNQPWLPAFYPSHVLARKNGLHATYHSTQPQTPSTHRTSFSDLELVVDLIFPTLISSSPNPNTNNISYQHTKQSIA